jgi:hypothetical protein
VIAGRAGAGLKPSSPASPAPARSSAAPVGGLAFLGVAVASFGGPLALGALYVPTILDDTSSSAGLVSLIGAAIFAIPLLVWLRYSRQIASGAGLTAFVAAAAGQRAALAHAALWIFSYALYLVYTTAAIVYDTLPVVLPWIGPYQRLLEIAIPVLLAAVMLAGRTATLVVLGALSVGQMALLGALAAVSIGRDAPASSFAAPAGTGGIGAASAQVALLYVCGSLPLYLGGEVRQPTRTVRRGLTAGYALVAAGVTAAVFPLAANPAFTHAPIPGMSLAQVFSGRPLAVAVGVGVAASTAGVMLVEYLALTRLIGTITPVTTRTATVALAAVLVVSAPLTLIDPERSYDLLLKPSLAALWLSQLMVFVVYPWFASRHGGVRALHALLAAGASLFAVYGLYMTFNAAST